MLGSVDDPVLQGMIPRVCRGLIELVPPSVDGIAHDEDSDPLVFNQYQVQCNPLSLRKSTKILMSDDIRRDLYGESARLACDEH
jgi:hypothetical protein